MPLPSSKIFLTVINKTVHTSCPLDLTLRYFWMALTTFLYQNYLKIQALYKKLILTIENDLPA